MIKKIFGLVSIIFMALLCPSVGLAETEYVAQIGNEKYETLTAAVNAVNTTTTTTIKLIDDVINEAAPLKIGREDGSKNSTLKQNITIDLNGYKIEKNNSTVIDAMFVIIGEATLTIDDTSKEKTGLITSGTSDIMRGVDVERGKLILKDGTITTSVKNTNWQGGGVNVWKQGEFVMEGGKIKDCKAGNLGGGVSVGSDNTSGKPADKGIFIMKGGSIENCSTNSWGGGVNNSGKFIMEGGVIKNNTSASGGGGITTSATATFIMTGGTVENNLSKGGNLDSSGGGVCGAGIIKIGGTAVITGNKWNSTTNNLYLRNNWYIELDNPSDEMNVGIILQNGMGKFTSNGTANNIGTFTPDNSDYAVHYHTDGYLDIALGYDLDVNVNDDAMGSATAKFSKVAAGNQVVLTAIPKAGYAFVKWESDDILDLSTGSFVMPDKKVSVKAIFEKSYNYEFLEGNNQEFKIDSIKSFVLKIDGDYSLFKGISIDKLDLVKDEDYEVTEGSTIITFTDKGVAKLNTLSNGEYKISVKYLNDKEVKGKLILTKEEPIIEEEKVDNPSTSYNVILYLIVGILSLISLVNCVCYLNLKKSN